MNIDVGVWGKGGSLPALWKEMWNSHANAHAFGVRSSWRAIEPVGAKSRLKQIVKANTTTLDCRAAFRGAKAIVRLEHRIDDSRGPEGGFFKDGEVTAGVIGLTPRQHLLIVALILAFDSL